MKIEIDIAPEKLVTKQGEVKFDPSNVTCAVCGKKMRLNGMNNDGQDYDFHYVCPDCDTDTRIWARQLHGFID